MSDYIQPVILPPAEPVPVEPLAVAEVVPTPVAVPVPIPEAVPTKDPELVDFADLAPTETFRRGLQYFDRGEIRPVSQKFPGDRRKSAGKRRRMDRARGKL